MTDDDGAADEAARLLERALKQARAEGSDRAVRLAAGRLGILRMSTGELEAGAAALDEATAASDRIRDAQGDPERRVAERTGDEDLFAYAAAAHVLLGRPLRAVEAIERLRARELLAARGPARSGVALPSLDAVRKIVRPGTAALYAWAVQDRSFCLLLLDDGTGALKTALGMSFGMTAPAVGPRWGTAVVAAEPLEGRTPAPSLAAVLGDRGGVPDFAALAGPLRELAEPWAGLLANHGVEAVRVVACGPLANVPWALLPGPDGEPLGLSAVMTAPPSLSWAASAPLDGPAKTRTVVVADTDPSRPLPYAAAEADHIARHGSATRLVGAAANREGVLHALADARVLHMACHGAAEHPRARAGAPWAAVTEADVIVLPPDDPDIGGILAARHDPPTAIAVALAGGQALRAADVERSRVVAGTELVVLAGCDTAVLARQRLSDEPVGLPSAFLAAGARAVVGALWPVDDDSAALLMARMHEALLAGEAAPAALAASQRWLAAAAADELREFVGARPDLARLGWPRLDGPMTGAPYAAPEHWAAFVHIG